HDVLVVRPAGFLKADQLQVGPTLDLRADERHRGKREPERLTGRGYEAEAVACICLDEDLLLLRREPITEHSVEHPLNRLPAVRGEDEQTAGREMPGEKVQKCRPAVTVQMRKQRAA